MKVLTFQKYKMKTKRHIDYHIQRKFHVYHIRLRAFINKLLKGILAAFLVLFLVNFIELAVISGIPEVNAETIIETPVVETIAETTPVVTKPISLPECELGFKSNNSGYVTPPSWFVDRVNQFSCKEQQLLTRIAFYESSWNENAVNKHNKYARGLYQILPNTLKLCQNNGASTPETCALWVAKYNYKWFESITRNKNSFTGLI